MKLVTNVLRRNEMRINFNINQIFAVLILLMFSLNSAWADDVDAKKKAMSGKHENTEEVNTAGDWDDDVDAVKKRGGPDGTTHPTHQQVRATGYWDGEVDAVNKRGGPLVSSEDNEFADLDADDDGMISQSEGNADRGITRYWGVVDADADGNISRAEFKDYYNRRYGYQRPLMHLGAEERTKRFKELDKDGNGEISSAEFYDGIM